MRVYWVQHDIHFRIEDIDVREEGRQLQVYDKDGLLEYIFNLDGSCPCSPACQVKLMWKDMPDRRIKCST